jgi:hypothetical protein
MTLLSRVRMVAAGVAIATVFAVSPSLAQEISETHMKAARAAVAAIKATQEFDGILPAAARALKNQLTQQSPDLYDLIDKTVNEKAMAMTARYGDLEKEAATAYAKVFSEADLNAIAAFYSSDAGKRLLSDGPIVTRELLKAADIWQRGVARDLAVQVAEILAKQGAPSMPNPDVTQPAPAGGAAPAPAPN